MGKVYDEITAGLRSWLEEQRLFFVATAPLSGDGLVNCSPKGMDTFRILGAREVAYLDVTGSGVETIAHLRENGRIVLMFCALSGPPKIVRLHGAGRVITPGNPEFSQMSSLFPEHPGTRAVVHVSLTRIGDSCGYAVPRYDYVGERDTLTRLAETKGEDGLAQYRREKNAQSLDGLPGLAEDE